MLNQSHQSDSSIDQERDKEEKILKRQQSIEQSTALNVKDHREKLENMLNELKKDLEQDKKHMSNLRLEQQTMKNQHYSNCEELSKFVTNQVVQQLYIYNQVARLVVDLHKKSQEIQQENDFYESQMKGLFLDKKKLDETTNILDQRISQCESDVGFRHVYD